MGTENLHDKAEELTGKAKQAVGDMTDNERLQAEGMAQEAKADAHQDVHEAAEDYAKAEKAEAETRS